MPLIGIIFTFFGTLNPLAMSATIQSYPITPGDIQTINLPENSKILTVQIHGDEPVMWVLVPDTLAKTVPRKFTFYPDNCVIANPDSLSYIGTFIIVTKPFHLFEII
jgi:hypothetical protein